MKKLHDRLLIAARNLLCILAIVTTLPECHADFISLTGAETATNIAEIELGRGTLTITLEVSAAEAGKFWPAIPHTDDLTALAADAARRSDLQLRVHSRGEVFQPGHYTVSVAERKVRNSPFAGKIDPRTGRKLPDFPEDKHILLVRAEYSLKDTERVSLVPPLDRAGRPSSNIGFITHHGSTVVNNFAFLSTAEALLIDWSDPWNTRFENPNLRRHIRYPLMSFLYIEPRQIRHDVLLRPGKLANWSGEPFDAWQPLTDSTRQRLAATAKEFLYQRNPASIDQRLTKPESTQVVFLKASETGFSLIPGAQQVELGSVLIGYRESYGVEQLPSQVEVQWGLFDKSVDTVPTLIQDPAGPFPTHTTTAFPTIEWQNFLKQYTEPVSAPVPVQMQRISLPSLLPLLVLTILMLSLISRFYRAKRSRLKRAFATVAAGLLIVIIGWIILPARFSLPLPGPANDQQLTAVTNDLLTRVAAAYLERDPRRLDTALSNLVSRNAFTSTSRNLARVYQPATSVGGKGNVSNISQLQLQNIERISVADEPSYRAIGSWLATVEGHYWGHSDRRQYQVRASLELCQEEGNWKIAAFTPVKFN